LYVVGGGSRVMKVCILPHIKEIVFFAPPPTPNRKNEKTVVQDITSKLTIFYYLKTAASMQKLIILGK